MPRPGPTSLALPPFAGATRRLILINVAIFFTLAILSLISRSVWSLLLSHLALTPIDVARGQLWQLGTYAFINDGLISTLFAMLTLWFTGSMLEGAYGPRWLYELYFVSILGGGALASLISFTHLFGLNPARAAAIGPYAGIFGLLIAIAIFFGDQEFLLFFFIRVKAKYLVAIYILVELAVLLKSSNAFDALVQLSGALAGFIFVRLAPRRGLAYGLTERYFSLRNDFYRNRRRRAARKFEVYMRKQNREVHFDHEGRYVDPDTLHPGERGDSGERGQPENRRDPNDKRWMN